MYSNKNFEDHKKATKSRGANTTTTIRIRNDTKNQLESIGRKNQSFNEIVSSLIKEHHLQNTDIEIVEASTTSPFMEI